MAKEIEDGPIEPRSGSIDSGSVETESGQSAPTEGPSPSPQAPTEKEWKEYNLDWDGKSREQIAREITFQRGVSGRQSQELGRLRKEYQTASQKLSELSKLAGGATNPEGQTVKEAVAEMDPAEKAMFFKELEEGDPRKALRRALGDLGIPKTDDIKKMIADGVKEQLGQYHDWNEENTLRSTDPDYAKNEEMVKWFRDPENTEGIPDRSRKECLDLVKLGNENQLLAGFVYDLMRKSNLPFAECKRISTLELSAQQTNDSAKEKIAGEIKKGNKTTPSGSKTVGSEGHAKTMDEAFS
jgi:hypothetical protein